MSEANVKRHSEQQAEEERRIKDQGFLEQSRRMAFPGAAPDNDDVIRRRAQIYAREDADRLAKLSLGERLFLSLLQVVLTEIATAGVFGESLLLPRAGPPVIGAAALEAKVAATSGGRRMLASTGTVEGETVSPALVKRVAERINGNAHPERVIFADSANAAERAEALQHLARAEAELGPVRALTVEQAGERIVIFRSQTALSRADFFEELRHLGQLRKGMTAELQAEFDAAAYMHRLWRAGRINNLEYGEVIDRMVGMLGKNGTPIEPSELIKLYEPWQPGTEGGGAVRDSMICLLISGSD